MTKQEYYSLREDIDNQNRLGERIRNLSDLLECYGILRNCTLVDTLEYLKDIYVEKSFDLEKRLCGDDASLPTNLTSTIDEISCLLTKFNIK